MDSAYVASIVAILAVFAIFSFGMLVFRYADGRMKTLCQLMTRSLQIYNAVLVQSHIPQDPELTSM